MILIPVKFVFNGNIILDDIDDNEIDSIDIQHLLNSANRSFYNIDFKFDENIVFDWNINTTPELLISDYKHKDNDNDA